MLIQWKVAAVWMYPTPSCIKDVLAFLVTIVVLWITIDPSSVWTDNCEKDFEKLKRFIGSLYRYLETPATRASPLGFWFDSSLRNFNSNRYGWIRRDHRVGVFHPLQPCRTVAGGRFYGKS